MGGPWLRSGSLAGEAIRVGALSAISHFLHGFPLGHNFSVSFLFARDIDGLECIRVIGFRWRLTLLFKDSFEDTELRELIDYLQQLEILGNVLAKQRTPCHADRPCSIVCSIYSPGLLSGHASTNPSQTPTSPNCTSPPPTKNPMSLLPSCQLQTHVLSANRPFA